SMLLTGAFHEDGLADTADALGGAYDRARLFEILKDSRIGSFGAAAIVLSIGARAAFYADLGPACAWALPPSACAARVGAVWLLATLPYATPTGAKSRAVAHAGAAQVAVASGWLALAGGAAVLAAGLSPARLGAMIAALAVVTLASGVVFFRRAG